MPHFLQGMKITHRYAWQTERERLAREKWNDARLRLKERLEDNRWLNPRRREFLRKRVFQGHFS